ncbi:MAG TPA: cyanophycinase [Candidatus Nanoarchaeia archaeon]|nr:cyanophycinase [Candidatus Nanoarchaeia archaeon]
MKFNRRQILEGSLGLASFFIGCGNNRSNNYRDAGLTAPADVLNPDSRQNLSGDAESIPDTGLPGYPSASGYPSGKVIIHGGNDNGPEIFRDTIYFTRNDLNAPVVICPTAWPNDHGESDLTANDIAAARYMMDILGFTNVTVLHTRNRNVANTEAFVEPLRSAYGVWFEGGRQPRIVDAYLNTLFHDEVRKVLDRGGIVGGTSAGASVMSSFLIRGQTGEAGHIVIGDHTEGFGFLRNVGIDQHVAQRGRENDLSQLVQLHPDHLGIGLDERTAAILDGDIMNVVGDGQVRIHYQALLLSGLPPILLNSGDSYNIATLKQF